MVTLDGFLMEKYMPGMIARGSHQQIAGPHHRHSETGGMGSRPGRAGRQQQPEPAHELLCPPVSSPLLDLIRSQGLLDDLQLDEVKEEHNRSGKPFSEILQDFGYIWTWRRSCS
jgi:hypothetical protein